MKKVIIYFLFLPFICFSFACKEGSGKAGNKVLPKVIVETEEVAYEWENTDTGPHPLWCHSSSIIARDNDEIIMSGIEGLKQYKPLNNLRWVLYKRTVQGKWEIQQTDEKGRQREPCPIGLFSNGNIVMSVNPNFEANPEKPAKVNQPQLLEFNTRNLKVHYKTYMPEWAGTPVFAPDTYRAFAVDRENNECVIFTNSSDLSHYEWSFFDRKGQWHGGHLNWAKYENDSITPYGEEYMGLTYPAIVVKNRAVHLFGCATINKWSRIRNLEDAKRVGLDNIAGRDGGRIAGGRFRRVYYTWTPDITKNEFSTFVEIDNSQENGENIRVTDMWAAPDGTMHLLWHQNPVNQNIRDEFWPEIKRVYAMKYAQIKDGKIILKKSLIVSGDVDKVPEIDGIKNYSITWGRFHIMPGKRLFLVYYISGINNEGKQEGQNRLLEIYNDGTVSESEKIPLKAPMSFYFTATPRGGSLPSKTIDMIGQKGNDRSKIRNAKIQLIKP